MREITFGELVVGQQFYKEGKLMVKTDPVRTGSCGCLTATARVVADEPNPLRLYQDSEAVEIMETLPEETNHDNGNS